MLDVVQNLAAIIDFIPRLTGEIGSPFPHYITRPSIHEPSPSEKEDIRGFTRGLQNMLQEIDAVLTVLQDASKFFETQKERYNESLKLHTAFLAPVNNLPFDILSRIFVDVHNLDLDDFRSELSSQIASYSSRSSYYPAAPAITVACVNRGWLQVAMNIPALWSTLVLSGNPNFEEQLQRATHWLERSRGSPLTWIILDGIWNGSGSKKWLEEHSLVSILLPHASQVRSLQLHGRVAPFLRQFRDQNATFPMLEHIDFGPKYQFDDLQPFSDLSLSECLLNAGPVKTIRLPYQVDVNHFIFDWSSVHSFSGRLDNEQLHKLWQSPALRSCKIADTNLNVDQLSTLQTAHSLTCLWLDIPTMFLVHQEPFPFRQLGSLPRLQSLIMSCPASIDKTAFLDLLRICSSTLHLLALDMGFSLTFIRQCLQLAPNLQRFDCYAPEDDLNLAGLCQMFVTEPVVPNLHQLFIKRINPDDTESARDRIHSLSWQERTTPPFRSSLALVGVQHADEDLYFPYEDRESDCEGDEYYPEYIIGCYFPSIKVELIPYSMEEFLHKYPYPGSEDL